MFIFIRAVTYAALFIGLVLIYVPARILSRAGIAPPASIHLQQIAGMAVEAIQPLKSGPRPGGDRERDSESENSLFEFSGSMTTGAASETRACPSTSRRGAHRSPLRRL